MDNMLNFPASTHVNRLVPKTAFYKHLEMNTRLKMRLVEDVERIQWLYKLAPSTMNVDAGKVVHEIVVLRVTLKVEDMPDDAFLAIDRQMPRHVVFVLQYANRVRLLLNYKEWADADKTRFNILKTFRTEWMPLIDVKLELVGLTLDNIYEDFVGQISGFVTNNAADTKQILALQDEIARKRRGAEALQKRVRNERQFAKQMELNNEVRDDKTGEISRKVNFEVLRRLLGDNATDGDGEMYQFTWVGKNAARAEAAKPTDKTLRPVPEDSVDWDNTKNVYIEGDNLEVLKLLQRSYMSKVKMIYIDPPYNTGNDFVYHDDFARPVAEEDLEAGNVDELGNRFRKNTDTNGKFHSDWCSMIYSRLLVARSLLTEDGVIFISIDDNEVRNLRNICDEVFGEHNFVANFIWEKRLNRENRKEVSVRHDYILCYTKMVEEQKRSLSLLPMNDKALSNYGNPDNDPRGLWKSDPAHAQGGHGTKSQFYTLTAPNGKKHELPSGRCWLYTEDVMNEAIKDNRIWFGKDGNGVPRIKTYLNAKERGLTPETLLFAKDASTNEKAKNDLKDLFDGIAVFETPKPVELI